MKWAPKAAATRNSAMIDVAVQRHANNARTPKVSAPTAAAKPAMNTAPRNDAISGSAAMARHNGQLANTAIHSAASSARVKGFQVEGSRRGMAPLSRAVTRHLRSCAVKARDEPPALHTCRGATLRRLSAADAPTAL